MGALGGGWGQRGHLEVKTFCGMVVRLGEGRKFTLDGDLLGALAGVPGFPASQPDGEHCPWRQDGRMVRGVGLGQIWTST